MMKNLEKQKLATIISKCEKVLAKKFIFGDGKPKIIQIYIPRDKDCGSLTICGIPGKRIADGKYNFNALEIKQACERFMLEF